MARPRRNTREATPEERAGSVPRNLPLDSPEYAAKLEEMRDMWQLASLMQFVSLFKGLLKLGVPSSDVSIEVLEEDLLGINMVPMLLNNVLKSLIQNNLEPRFQTGTTGGDLDFIYTRKARPYLVVKPKDKNKDKLDQEQVLEDVEMKEEEENEAGEEVESTKQDVSDSSSREVSTVVGNETNDDDEEPPSGDIKTKQEVEDELSVVSKLPEFQMLFQHTQYNSEKQRFYGFDFDKLDIAEKIVMLHQLTVWMTCDHRFREKLELYAKSLGVYVDYFRMEPLGHKGAMISYYLLDDMRLYYKEEFAPDTSDVVTEKESNPEPKGKSSKAKSAQKSRTQAAKVNAKSQQKKKTNTTTTPAKRRSTRSSTASSKKPRRSLRSQPEPQGRRSSRRLAVLEKSEDEFEAGEDKEEEDDDDDDEEQQEVEDEDEDDGDNTALELEEAAGSNGTAGVTMQTALAREYEPVWTCLCWDLASWKEFLRKIRKSRDKNEARLSKYLQNEVLEQLEEYEKTRISAAMHREKQREKVVLVANRKRSSRIELSQARQQEEEAARARAEQMLQEERERKRAERDRARREQARNKKFIEKRLEKFANRWQKLQQRWEQEFLDSLKAKPVEETTKPHSKEVTPKPEETTGDQVGQAGQVDQAGQAGQAGQAYQADQADAATVTDAGNTAVKTESPDVSITTSPEPRNASAGPAAPKPINKELLALLGNDAYNLLEESSKRTIRERKPRALDDDERAASTPAASRTRTRGTNIEEEEMWYFRCPTCGVEGINIDDGNPSVACERCNCWVHLNCLPEEQQAKVNESQNVDNGYSFLCSICEDEEQLEKEKIANDYWKKKKRAEEYKERRKKKKELEAEARAKLDAEAKAIKASTADLQPRMESKEESGNISEYQSQIRVVDCTTSTDLNVLREAQKPNLADAPRTLGSSVIGLERGNEIADQKPGSSGSSSNGILFVHENGMDTNGTALGYSPSGNTGVGTESNADRNSNGVGQGRVPEVTSFHHYSPPIQKQEQQKLELPKMSEVGVVGVGGGAHLNHLKESQSQFVPVLNSQQQSQSPPQPLPPPAFPSLPPLHSLHQTNFGSQAFLPPQRPPPLSGALAQANANSISPNPESGETPPLSSSVPVESLISHDPNPVVIGDQSSKKESLSIDRSSTQTNEKKDKIQPDIGSSAL